MKKPIFIIMGLVLLTVMIGQTYLMYSINKQLNRLTANNPGNLLQSDPQDNDFFGTPARKSNVYKMKLNGLSAPGILFRSF